MSIRPKTTKRLRPHEVPRGEGILRQCSVTGCYKAHRSKGFCNGHYQKWVKYGDPTASVKTPNGARRAFLENTVLLHTSNKCLAWPYSRRDGYGVIQDEEGRQTNVSRVVCERIHGPPPSPEHEAAHSCGKGHEGCVSPHHLSWKTPVENQQDKTLHGTDNSLLTQQDVVDIVNRYPRERGVDLAKEYNIPKQTVYNISSGRSYHRFTNGKGG